MRYTCELAGRVGAASLAALLKAAGCSRAVVATAVVATLDLPEDGESRRCSLTPGEVARVEAECRDLWRARDRRRARSAA